jgi:hypothetical protein
MRSFDAYRESIVAYRKWLEGQRVEACKRYLDRLADPNDGREEGAVCEAVAWDWLASRCRVTLFESETDGGPDFRCHCKAGDFLVEVGALTIDAGSTATGLDHDARTGPKHYSTATRAIKARVMKKAEQIGKQGLPAIVFVPTLHFEISAVATSTHHLEELLIGATVISGVYDHDTGTVEMAESEVATLDHPLFMQSRTGMPLRRNISAVVVGGFGPLPPQCVVRGVLNQNAIRPFDPMCLPDLCCGRIEPWPPGKSVSVAWQLANGQLCDDDSEHVRHQAAVERRLRRQGLGGLLDEIERRGAG